MLRWHALITLAMVEKPLGFWLYRLADKARDIRTWQTWDMHCHSAESFLPPLCLLDSPSLAPPRSLLLLSKTDGRTRIRTHIHTCAHSIASHRVRRTSTMPVAGGLPLAGDGASLGIYMLSVQTDIATHLINNNEPLGSLASPGSTLGNRTELSSAKQKSSSFAVLQDWLTESF